MPIITVRLDRVFDVVQLRYQEDQCTLFSIEYGGRAHYGVTLPGIHEFQDGMVVTAFLERDGDWQSMTAWRNHATGEIVCRSALFDVFPIFLAFFLAVFAFVFWDPVPVISVLLLAGAVGMLRWGIRAMDRRGNVIAQLKNATGMPS